MDGLARAVGRLLIMAAVLAGVLVACLVAGVGTTIAVALAIVLAGMVGLVGVARRPARPDEQPADAAGGHLVADPDEPRGTAASAANRATTPVPADPEALMPRWRRPSLLEARRADPTRATARTNNPLRFDARPAEADVRVIRYAVVPLLDSPDEVLGTRIVDLGAGDEVQVVGAYGAFLEVACASGERGWIHRTTVGEAIPAYSPPAYVEPAHDGGHDAEDALTALLAARGLQ